MTGRARRVVACVKPPGGAPPGGINVTPLVDVVLVLLIIFMVVTPLREESLGVRLPAPAQSPAPTPPRPPLGVGILATGALVVDGAPVEDGAYEGVLAAALRARAEAERVVVFSAADAAPYRRLVLAMERARRAGAETLALAEAAPAAPPVR